MNPGSSIDEAEEKKESSRAKIAQIPRIAGRKFIRVS
jgi:hypothetical protein